MKKNKDDITLSAVLDFDVNQEDEALMRAYMCSYVLQHHL